VSAEQDAELLALDEAMKTLAQTYPRRSQVVELRYFGGLNNEEVAAVLKVTSKTVERDWRYARAWLYDELQLK
jgi:RNA polymerase sigma factor (TIGR02999 family)